MDKISDNDKCHEVAEADNVIIMGPGEPLWTGWLWEASLMRWPLN